VAARIWRRLPATHQAGPPTIRRVAAATWREANLLQYLDQGAKFCLRAHTEGHLSERPELPRLKVEQRMLQTLTDELMQALRSAKNKRFDQFRLRALVCLVLDTGVRIEEASTLRRADVDFDNLLVTVFGKGRKGAARSVLVRATEGAVSVGPEEDGSVSVVGLLCGTRTVGDNGILHVRRWAEQCRIPVLRFDVPTEDGSAIIEVYPAIAKLKGQEVSQPALQRLLPADAVAGTDECDAAICCSMALAFALDGKSDLCPDSCRRTGA
jgi:Phage integrase family